MRDRNYKGRPEKSCGIILLNDAREYLILRHQPGHWDFPKGHVEKGETEEETALREILEETGLKARIVPDFRETVEYLVRGHIPKTVVFFLGRPLTEKITLQEEEISDHAFLPYDEARKQLSFDSNRKLLDKAHAFVTSQLKES